MSVFENSLLRDKVAVVSSSIPYEKFSLFKFYSRYICGGTALKQSRGVSRRRISLIKLGLNLSDKDALNVFRDIENFNSAFELPISSHKISINFLNSAHSMLLYGKDGCSKFRRSQNWVGGRTFHDAEYIPPNANDLEEIMDGYINDCSLDRFDDFTNSIIWHANIINAHPYDDGNGRLSRLVAEKFFHSFSSNSIPISLFRFLNNDSYLECIKSSRSDMLMYLSHDYWLDNLKWMSGLSVTINDKFNLFYSALESKKILYNGGGCFGKVFSMLLTFPLLTSENLSIKTGMELKLCDSFLRILVDLNILKPWKLKGSVVFECKDVFDFWDFLDELILKRGDYEGFF